MLVLGFHGNRHRRRRDKGAVYDWSLGCGVLRRWSVDFRSSNWRNKCFVRLRSNRLLGVAWVILTWTTVFAATTVTVAAIIA